MTVWRFRSPCEISVGIPDVMVLNDMQAGIEAALLQLTSLPAGTTVQLSSLGRWDRALPVAAAAIAAVAAQLPNLTIITPDVPGEQWALTRLSLCNPPIRHAAATALPDVWSASATLSWAWDSLRLTPTMDLTNPLDSLLHVSDTSGRQRELTGSLFFHINPTLVR